MNLPQPIPNLEKLIPHRHDRAYAYLKGLLLDGGLEPRDVISSEGVARALDISRAPVTDALRRLARDGFFDVVPQVGCVVRAPGPQEVGDFYRLFASSEAVITGLAAERRSPAQVARFQLTAAALDAECDRLRLEAEAGPAFRELNRQRYEAIHALANSSIAGELVANMWDRSDFYIRIAYGEFLYASSIQQIHWRICQAIVEGDAATASTKTVDYLHRVGRQIAGKLAERPSAKP